MNKTNKVQVWTTVQRGGKTFRRKQWVNPSDVKNTDDKKQKEAVQAFANMSRRIAAVSKPVFVDSVMKLHEDLKRAPIYEPSKTKLYAALEKKVPENIIESPPKGAEKLEITKEDIKNIKTSLLRGETVELDIDLITEESQIRKSYDPETVQNIADSVVEQGLLHSITVRPDPGNPGKFQLVDGHTRLRAVKKAIAEGRLDASSISATVEDMDDKTKAIRQLVANVARKENSSLEFSDH